MDDRITAIFEKYCDGELSQIIISNSRKPEELKKVTIRPVRLQGGLRFQTCEYRGAKVFHENHTARSLLDRLPDWLETCMKQAEIRSRRADVTILISKKGQVTIRERKKAAASAETAKTVLSGTEKPHSPEPAPAAKHAEPAGVPPECCGDAALEHNRTKNYILREGTPVPFLVELGVMTDKGRVVHSRYDKFRQINRFLEFIEDVLPELPADRELAILDFGCGKSYLTFAMYYYLHEQKGYSVRITGLDLKEDVIERCNALAERFGCSGLHFQRGDIASYEGSSSVDLVVTLHACDTATDYALEKAVGWGAKVILSVPCCQHELNRTLANDMLAPVLKYGLLKERMAALITDGLRAALLEQLGYQVQVLEFIDMEHTPKNILIRAVRKNIVVPAAARRERRERYENCIRELHVNPTLYRDMMGG